MGPFDLNTCVLSPREGFCSLHLPNSLSGTPTSQMFCLLGQSFMSLIFLIFSISLSFCSTFCSLTLYFNLLIKFFILAFILLIFKSSLLFDLHSNSWLSWLHHLKAFCRSSENCCLLPELALFPLESVLTFIYLWLSIQCFKFFFLSFFPWGLIL